MGHEIMRNDKVVFVRLPAWHGLGVVLPEELSFQEAWRRGLLPDFRIEIRAAYYESPPGSGCYHLIPGRRAILRVDPTGEVSALGTIGGLYEPLQNEELWKFGDELAKELPGRLETAGSLRGGRVVWGLIRTEETEYVRGDPCQEFILLVTTHDGTGALRVLTTNVRVVCMNTLTAALRGSTNVLWIRHTEGKIQGAGAAIVQALGVRKNWREVFGEAMRTLARKQFTAGQMEDLTRNILSERKEPEKDIRRILHLVETGAGAELPGVRGTAYGLFQAVTEWANHELPTRETDRSTRQENRFASVMLPEGRGTNLVNRSLEMLLAA